MTNFSVGLLNCAITKQLDKCVSAQLGYINTEGQEPVEVWANLSEVALLSLRRDLLYPDNRAHGCIIGPGECCIMGRDAICIRTLVAVIPEVVDGQLTGRKALIHACFSEDGLDLLLQHLKEDVMPLNLAPVAEARSATPYQWTVVHRDCEIVSQFLYGQPEKTWADVRPAAVDLLIVEPRDAFSNLPTYRLHECGFEQLNKDGTERLPLPMPDEPFAFVYYRRVTVTYFCENGSGQPAAPRIVQVLGWRVGSPDNGLLCELGVEEDGSWIIYRRGRLLAGGEYVPLMEEEFLEALEERSEV